jgi:hypothetical protein
MEQEPELMKRVIWITLSASLKWIPMRTSIIVGLLLAGSAAGFLAIGKSAGDSLSDVLGRYPGTLYPVGQQVPLRFFDGDGLQRQAAYQTRDDPAVVLRWYVARLHIAPVWDLGQGAGCAWLARTQSAVVVAHTASVQFCATPGGTRILLYESLTFAW